MKTIWIIDNYSSEPKYGGISRQHDFAVELSKRGYKVIIFSSSYLHFTHSYISDDDRIISQIAENAFYIYLRIHPYQGNGLDRAWSMFSFCRAVLRSYKQIEEQFGRPDVVEGCSVHPFSWVAAQRIAAHYHVPFIAEVRDLWPEVWLLSGEKSKYDPMVIFFRRLEKWAYKKADGIICSMLYGDRYVCGKLGFPREKVHIIGQPMDCERYDRLAQTGWELIPAEIREFMRDGFRCVFTGYYQKYDGVFVMLEAAKLLRERGLPIKMLFVGSGPEYDGMLEYAKSNSLDNVYIGERVSKDAIPAILRRADVCMAHIGYKDNRNAFQYGVSKNKVNEYMYSGACIVYGRDNPEDPVASSGGGIVVPTFDVPAFADAIEKFYRMTPEQRKQYGENGCKYAIENHRVDVLADKLLKVYKI